MHSGCPFASILAPFWHLVAPLGPQRYDFSRSGAPSRAPLRTVRAQVRFEVNLGAPGGGQKLVGGMRPALVGARENCTLAPLAVLPLGFQHILRFYRRVLPVKQLTKVSCSKLRFSRSFTESVQELVIVQWMCRRVALKTGYPTRRRSCDFTARRI